MHHKTLTTNLYFLSAFRLSERSYEPLKAIILLLNRACKVHDSTEPFRVIGGPNHASGIPRIFED